MVIASSSYYLIKFPFVDREDYKQIFIDFLEASKQKKYNVLHYWGISGIGKSMLQQEIQSVLTNEYPDVLLANVDFKVKKCREIGTFLFSLRNQLAKNYKVKFDYFDIVLKYYMRKNNPEKALFKGKLSSIEDHGTVDFVQGAIKEDVSFKSVLDISNYFLHAPAMLKKWWIEKGLKFEDRLEQATPNQIEQLLPLFFFTDLKTQLEIKSKTAVFFIDTYEALWEEARDRGNFNSRDEWVRSIIECSENVSWIICGQNKLRWDEIDNKWDKDLAQHEIGILPKEYCTEFLELCGVDEKDIQSVIIEASECYPFYLALSVDTYWNIKEKRELVPEDFPKNRSEIFASFFYYLDLPEKSTLLTLSNANFWDHDLLNLLIDEFGTNYPKSEIAFKELHRFSFMNENSDGTWNMHPLMRNSLQENQKTEQKEKIHKYLFTYYDKQLDDIDIKMIEEMHKNAFKEAFYHGIQSMEIEDILPWFTIRSEIFNKAGLWEFLIPLYNNICNILERTLGSENLDVANSLNNLAFLYYQMGKYDEAVSLLESALEIRKKNLSSEHLDVATNLNNLAGLYQIKGMYEEALSLYTQAFEIFEKILDSEHPEVAANLNNLALLYYYIGKYKEAIPLYERALKIFKKTWGSEHPDVATGLNNLALLYHSMGKYDKALPLYEQALEIREKILGPKHPDVASSLNTLAFLQCQMGKYDEALPLYKRALEIREKMLGAEHPDIANTVNNMAELYDSVGMYDEALLLYQKALEIRKNIFGFEHPDVAISLNNLALLYASIGKYDEALSLLKQALEIREKTLGPEHPYFATSLNNLAALYMEMGNYESALPLYKRSLKIREETLDPEHPDVANSLNNLGLLYHHIGESNEAVLLLKHALDIFEKRLGPEHPNVAKSLSNLTLIYDSMGKYYEALPLCERALEIHKKTLGTQHPSYVRTLNTFISLLHKMGK